MSIAQTITVIANSGNSCTLTLSDGNSTYDMYISKVTVYSQGNNVTIQWDTDLINSYTANYLQFSNPNGKSLGSAAAVESAIAALLVLSGGGGGSIGGSIAAPQIAYGTGANTIGGSNNLEYNSGGNNEVDLQKIKIAQTTLLSIPSDGYLEYDGSNVYFSIGSTRYKFSLTT